MFETWHLQDKVAYKIKWLSKTWSWPCLSADVVDTYSNVTHAELYTSKTPITTADLFNDRVLTFYEKYEPPMLRIFIDWGIENCGQADQHDYQLYIALHDIEHTKTKVKSPQTNGICIRFHKTILNKFYQIALR